MDKIDLDAMANKMVDDYHYLLPAIQQSIQSYAKEAIRQALVLASEKATIYTETFSSPHTHEWEKRIDKQSTLDVNDLVV